MKYLILFIPLFIALSVRSQTIIDPGIKGKTAFIIVIDKNTYEATKEAVNNYKSMLEEKEKLSTYLVIKDWLSPEEVKDAIHSVASKNPTLEGAVFIGHIPVALIRNAQHMTTAFKMDEIKYPIQQSSVASDRYYDDFDLRFRFLKRDEKYPDWFYYELDESCPQIITSDIYTGRIMSHKQGPEQYKEISDYLRKAVSARKTPETLDRLLAFTGYGYNSESLTAWVDEQNALKELFPQPFKISGNAKMLNFRMDPKMKFTLFSELQQHGLDLALLSEHGDITQQYINGQEAGNDHEFFYNNLRLHARTMLRRAASRKQDTAALKARFKTNYHLDDSWFEGAFGNDSLLTADSLVQVSREIITQDLKQFTPQAKVVIFNACYNGSFHHPDNIAGAYIFSTGNTIVTQGNTTNALQDKWMLDHFGLLNKGVRIGLWAFQNNTLESHLSGDPTWHFTFGEGNQLNTELARSKKDILIWKASLLKNDPVIQSISLKQLYTADMPGISSLLLQTFKKSVYLNVRMQCLNLLSRIGDENYKKVLPLAFNDTYELIRRKSIDWAARSGDSALIPFLVTTALRSPNDDRVMYAVKKCLQLMDPEKAKHEITLQVNAATYLFHKNEFLAEWLDEINKNNERAEENMVLIENKKEPEEKRIQAVRIIRNYTYHHQVIRLLKVAEDTSESTAIRQNMIEALGWFSNSYQKPSIIAACRRIQNNSENNMLVNKEAIQTVLRLEKWNLQ